VQWWLEEVDAGSSYTIVSELEGAMLVCHWRFEPVFGGTLLTQEIGLSGPEVTRHAEGIRSLFGSTLAPGMRRIAALLSDAQMRMEGAAQQGDEADKA
jgi:hypothetical protein